MTWLLALHTTTPVLGLAMMPLDSADPSSIRSQSCQLDRTMASRLHPFLAQIIEPQCWSDLAAVAVAVGPGSFTGCRLGVTVARTLGQNLRIPVYGISSLAAVAQTATDAPLMGVQLDAQRGQWYGGIYRIRDGSLEPEVADSLWTEADWLEKVQAYATIKSLDAGDYQDPVPVISVAVLGAQQFRRGMVSEWGSVVPNYARQPPIHDGSGRS